MADKKEFVTSLVVEADDTQVAKLRDTLQQVAGIIQGIQAQGPIGRGGAAGGGGAGGAGGGGGWGPGGSGSGGPSGWGGGQGGGGGSGGGGPPGQGGQPPGGGPSRQYGMGAAQIVAQQDEGVLSSVAAAAPSVLPFVGAAFGAAAGAIVSATLSRGRMALEFDRQRAATSGLLRGRAPNADSGAALGFMPAETQDMAQEMARSGVSADVLFGKGKLPESERSPYSLFQAGLLAQRAGIGAGSVANYMSMFTPMGGGVLSPIEGVSGGGTTSMRMEASLGIAIGSALRLGLQNSDIPRYLERIVSSVGAMASKGVQIDPNDIFSLAEQMGQRAGKRSIADKTIAENLGDIGQLVAEGGGTPIQQHYALMAGGLGKPGVSLRDALVTLQKRKGDWKSVFSRMREDVGDDPNRRSAYAVRTAREFGVGIEKMEEYLTGDSGDVDLLELARYGAEMLSKLGGKGVTDWMTQEAGIQAADIKAGMNSAPNNLRARRMMHGMVNRATGPISNAIGTIMNILNPGSPRAGTPYGNLPPAEQANPVLRGAAAARAMEELDFNAGPQGFDVGEGPGGPRPTRLRMPAPPPPEPNPREGGGYLEIRPAPGMERFFAFHFVPVQDMDGAGVPG